LFWSLSDRDLDVRQRSLAGIQITGTIRVTRAPSPA
jgi:hypothetical protein